MHLLYQNLIQIHAKFPVSETSERKLSKGHVANPPKIGKYLNFHCPHPFEIPNFENHVWLIRRLEVTYTHV
jgi:hypothetical protein